MTGPVVVTGASQGIGRTVALAFAADGARVALAARSAERLAAVAEEVRAAGGDPLAVATDVGDPAAVERLAASVGDRWGAAEVLVAVAGIAGPIAPAWELSVAEWEATLRTNVTGVFLCCRAFLPAMVARGRGSVVVIGSMTGKRPLPNRAAYATSKAALIGLVRTLAADAGASGVRVNLVSPGPVHGERLDRVLPEKARARLLADSPLGRFTTAGEVAAAVRFLCSEAASGITGEDLNVSTGTVMHG
jgi:NAD(P)-dependent dehydrogenase (short-subunit alcohol dehydrogenase family)